MSATTRTTEAPPELWDIDRLAEYLGTGRRFIYRITEEGRIRYLKPGGRLRFDPADVAEFLEREKAQHDRPSDPAPAAPAPRRGRPRAR
jgi:excisionase family DNA binding protein